MGRRKEEKKKQTAQSCEMDGCKEAGEYKAPKSRGRLHEYQWLCLDHVRDYNKAWDYFKGMQPEEIEAFRYDALLGHRPTWKTNQRTTPSKKDIWEALRRFGFTEAAPKPSLPKKLLQALAAMQLEHPTTVKEVKKSYKALVKRYHPDKTGGSAKDTERFRSITEAYHYLQTYYGKEDETRGE